MASKFTMLFCIKLREGEREEYCFLMPLIQLQHCIKSIDESQLHDPLRYKCVRGGEWENTVHGEEIISKGHLYTLKRSTNVEWESGDSARESIQKYIYLNKRKITQSKFRSWKFCIQFQLILILNSLCSRCIIPFSSCHKSKISLVRYY